MPSKLLLLTICLLATIYGLLIGSNFNNQGLEPLQGELNPNDNFVTPPQVKEASSEEFSTIGSSKNSNPSEKDLEAKKANGKNDFRFKKHGNTNFGPVDEWCGEICDITMEGRPTKYHPFIRKKVNCDSIMKGLDTLPIYNDVKNRKYGWPPPRMPPEDLFDRYTMWGQMPFSQTYYFAQDQVGNSRTKPITEEEIEVLIRRRAKRTGMGSYGLLQEDLLQMALTKYTANDTYVTNKIGLDFGSSDNAWITTMGLLNGASLMYMMDYKSILSHHPKILGLLPKDLYLMWKESKEKNSSHPSIDFAISYSSIEHSGLGRYGDELYPEGDFVAMAQIWCVLPPGSILFLNVPFHPQGSTLVWNAHRIYGPDRLEHLTANWEVLDFFDACSIIKEKDCRKGVQISTALWVLKSVPAL